MGNRNRGYVVQQGQQVVATCETRVCRNAMPKGSSPIAPGVSEPNLACPIVLVYFRTPARPSLRGIEAMHFDKRIAFAAAGITAAGVGFATAYYLYRSENASSCLIILPIRLEKYHEQYLQQVAEKYTRGDQQKALQTIVQHCMNATSDDTVDERIFKTVRCNSCGKKEKVAFQAMLPKTQAQFITTMVAKHDIGGGDEKVVRILFEYCINDVENALIFAQ